MSQSHLVSAAGTAFGSAPTPEIVTVPDLPAADLVALVKERTGLSYLDPDYEGWDFYLDAKGKSHESEECGRTFEVARRPLGPVSSDRVRGYFDGLGDDRPFRGLVAPMLSWVLANYGHEDHEEDAGDGWFASIPEDDRAFRVANHGLYAPCFNRHGARRKLGLGELAGDWRDDYVFVAFREYRP